MKPAIKYTSVLLSCLLICLTTMGQSNNTATDKSKEKNKLSDYYIDFSIPDLGAFTLLNTKPDYIITPGSTKEFSASIMSVITSGYTITPGLAFDWSPGYTFIKSYSPATYRSNAMFRNLQLTAGTVADSGGTRVAVGLRWTFIDKTDPLMDPALSDKLESLNRQCFLDNSRAENNFLLAITAFLDSITTGYNIPSTFNLTEAVKTILNPSREIALRETTDNNFAHCIDTITIIFKQAGKKDLLSHEEKDALYRFCEQFSKIETLGEVYRLKNQADFANAKKDWMKENWNATIMSFGMGWTGNSPNNKWSKLSIQTLKAYLNGQFKAGKKSQIIGMLTFTMPQSGLNLDSTITSQAFAAARFLTGNERNRFSVDLGYGYYFAKASSFNKQTLNIAIGGEIKLGEGIFFEVAAGFNGQPSDFFSNSNILALGGLKYALHPKQRFPTGE